MWTHFHPATKKKSTKGAGKLRAKERLAAIKTIESSVDDSVVSIFADNCADLLEYLDNNWNIGHNDEEKEAIPVAVVNCSFSHVFYFRKALKQKIKNVFTIESDAPFKSIVEKMKHSKPSVFLVEQFESLPAEYVEKLLCLVMWFSLRHSFILCVSTGVDAFLETCSLPILRCINTSVFYMPEPSYLLEVIMENVFDMTIAHSFYLSSEVFSLLRSRYLCNSFCTKELKSTLRLCIQHKLWMSHMDADLEEQDVFKENVKRYIENLKFYCSAVKMPIHKCHEQVQAKLYDPHSVPIKLNILQEWMKQSCVNEILRTKMEECLSTYELGKKNSHMDKEPTVAALYNQKMTTTQLKQINEAIISANFKEKQTNPEILLQRAFNDIFCGIIRPWDSFPGSEANLIKPGPEKVRYCNSANIVEDAMLQEDNKTEPLSVAFRTLQHRANWKSAKALDWLKYYKDELMEDDDPVSFHAVLSQLEAMGVIKVNSEKNKGTLMVIRHPLTHTLN